MTNKNQVYKDYIEAKLSKTPIETVYTKHKITKQGMYFIIRQIENGSIAKIKACTEKSQLLCLWEHKYKLRISLLPKNRKKETVEMLKGIIKEMKKDGFKPVMLSSLIGKDRATVLYHLK